MIKIELPHKISTNTYYRLHYLKKSDIHHDFYWVAKEAVSGLKMPQVTYPIKMRYVFYFTGKLLDVINTSAMVKMLEDGFIRSGLIPDDTPKYINEIELHVKHCPKGEVDHCTVEILTN